jgi:hypothetical protein
MWRNWSFSRRQPEPGLSPALFRAELPAVVCRLAMAARAGERITVSGFAGLNLFENIIMTICRRLALPSLFAFVAAALLAFGGLRPEFAQGAETWHGPTFQEFSGVCQGSPTSDLNGIAVGWERHDLYWSQVEPTQGEWKEDALDTWGKTVLTFAAHGVHVLPVLDFNTSWSFDRGARTWEYNGERWQSQPRPDGKYDVAHYTRQPDNTWKLKETQVWTANDKWPLAAEHVPDWQEYVRHVVSFLRKPPYNVEYFQIWNEAHPSSGFWDGDMDDYINRVQLPAAKIIHELGGKVVYGGWPCCGALADLTALLDKNHAWSSIDVIDCHYFPVKAYDDLHKSAALRGNPNVRIWQSEVGFTTDPGYISNTYPRLLCWALRNRWKQADQYKAFYFADWSPNDPKAYGYGRTLHSGSDLSAHGKSLMTLASLLGGGEIRAQDGVVAATPRLVTDIDESRESIEAFRVGLRVVVAVHLHANAAVPASVELNLPFALPSIKRIERVDAAGETSDITAFGSVAGKGQSVVSVPATDAPGSDAASWFANASIRTFYVAVTLK